MSNSNPSPNPNPSSITDSNQIQQLLIEIDNTSSKLNNFTTYYALDESGSTHINDIMRYQFDSLNRLNSIIKGHKFIGWQSSAHYINIDHMPRSYGGTYPSCILPLVNSDCQCLVIYTDGQIPSQSAKHFVKSMEKLSGKPIIMILTLSSYYNSNSTIRSIENQVNMSIPEGCATNTNDLLVLLNLGGKHYNLLASGSFQGLFEIIDLHNDTTLEQLPETNLDNLNYVTVDNLNINPKEYIKYDSTHLIQMEKVYQMTHIPIEILNILSTRLNLSKLDLNKLTPILLDMRKQLDENKELDSVRQALTDEIISGNMGSARHRELLDAYKRIKYETNSSEYIRQYRKAVIEFLDKIATYRRESSSFVLGSNRALRAIELDGDQLENISDTLTGECPVFLDELPLALMLGRPNLSVEDCTSDYHLEAPFHLGAKLIDSLSTNTELVSYEFASRVNSNPFTREYVHGAIPLSTNPEIIMTHMNKIFGGNRKLYHMVRAYFGLIIEARSKYQWMANNELLLEQLRILASKYVTTKDLKANSIKTTFDKALEYVCSRPQHCLRNRSPNDVRVIVKIAKELYPDFSFNDKKILAMVDFIELFSFLLRKHKQECPMEEYIMNLDEYGHPESFNYDATSVIARLFWYDSTGKYKKMKLQLAIDEALYDSQFGGIFKSLIEGSPYSEDDPSLKVALPEPQGKYFEYPPKYENWDSTTGRPDFRCVFSGKRFETKRDLLEHLKFHMGSYFLNIHKEVLFVINQYKAQDLKSIYRLVINRLYKSYGKHNPVLYTRFVRHRIIYFSNKMGITA